MDLQRFKTSIFSFSSKYPLIIILLVAGLTLFFGYQAIHLEINADYASLLPEDTDANRHIRNYGGEKPESDLLVVAVKGNNLFTEEILSAFAGCIDEIGRQPEVLSVISPFNFLIFNKNQSGRLHIKKTMDIEGTSVPAEEINNFKSSLLSSRFAKNLVVSPDGTMLTAFFFTERRDEYTRLLGSVDSILEDLSVPGVSVHTSGLVVLNDRTRYYISRDVTLLILLAVLIVLAFYFITFRTGKAMLMPILVVLFGTVWSLGFMSLTDYSLTLISIVAPPLILIFGNEYAIYVMSEYYRLIEQRSDNKEITGTEVILPEVILPAVHNVTKPIILAFITTVIGFMSLYVTEIKQTQEFAIIAGFGSFACGFIALIFLPAILSLSKAKPRRRAGNKGYPRYVKGFTELASHHPRLILLSIPVIILLFLFSLQFLRFNTDSINYFPKNDPAIQDMYVLTEGIGGFDEVNVTFLAPEGEEGYFFDPEILRDIYRLEEELAANPDVCYTMSFASYIAEISSVMGQNPEEGFSTGLVRLVSRLLKTAAAADSGDGGLAGSLGNLFNDDFTRLTLNMRVYNSTTGHFIDEYRFREFYSFLQDTLSSHGFEEQDRAIWGEIMRNLELADSLRGYLLISMVISLGLILIITTATFKSLRYGIYAVLPLAMGLMFNFALMALFKIPLDMTTIMVSNVTIGVGIDNAFYLVVQYRRSLNNNHREFKALIGETLEVILRPTILSTLSITLGLLVFLVASFKPIVYFGMLVIFSLSATAVCTLVVIPAILYFDYRKRQNSPAPG